MHLQFGGMCEARLSLSRYFDICQVSCHIYATSLSYFCSSLITCLYFRDPLKYILSMLVYNLEIAILNESSLTLELQTLFWSHKNLYFWCTQVNVFWHLDFCLSIELYSPVKQRYSWFGETAVWSVDTNNALWHACVQRDIKMQKNHQTLHKGVCKD